MNLKQEGAFISRGLSFQQCTFDVVIHELAETQAGAAYDEVDRWDVCV